MPFPGPSLYPSGALYPGDLSSETISPPGTPATTTHGATEKLQPGRYMLRHIAPKALTETAPGVYLPLGAGFPVLAQTLYADPLPQLRIPTSPDWHEGKYVLRVLDAGEFSIGFPNKDASDGQPWRSRFQTRGHNEFIEISREGELEFVGVIIKQSKDRGRVVLEGYDGMFLLKKGFEQDFTGVLAPRDLIERYTSLPVMPFGSFFQSTEFPESVSSFSFNAGTAVPSTSGVLCTAFNAASGSTGGIKVATAINPTRPFSVLATFTITSSTSFASAYLSLVSGVGGGSEVGITLQAEVQGATPTITNLQAKSSVGGTTWGSTFRQQAGAFVAQHSMLIDSDGTWARMYYDGVFVGIVPAVLSAEALQVIFQARTGEAGRAINITLQELIVEERAPFLMRGAEKGQYVLPGGVGAYPTGGLHARYRQWSGVTTYPLITGASAPDPSAPGFPQFKESQENCNITEPGKVVGIAPPFGLKMFGAIYLPLSKGNVTLQMNRSGAGVGFRVWVGKTLINQQIIDDFSTESATAAVSGTVNAAALGAKDGWYPIVIESLFALERGMALLIVPNSTYVDPGGTELKNGVGAIVPATSLSPIGCVDARYQGSSFFDIVQETAKNWGLQLRCEPRQLESGEFPGQIVPKERLGKDTDEIIEAGDIDRRSEFNNYTATEDATDTATSLKAFGSGIADGKGSQVAFEAVSPADATAALFNLQAWLNAGDIAFPQLLAARANAELGLRTDPWENIEGEPVARDRLADTFPLTGILSQFRWQPGDGVRLRLPDVDIEDLTPRQILQITRNFSPDGRTGTSIGFRARPRDPLQALRQALRDATRPPRAFQRQYVTRSSEHVGSNNATVEKGNFTTYMIVPLDPQEKIVSAIAYLSVVSPQGAKVGVEVNGTLRTSALGGPWGIAIPIDISRFTSSTGLQNDHRLYVRFKNEDVGNVSIEGMVVVTLLV